MSGASSGARRRLLLRAVGTAVGVAAVGWAALRALEGPDGARARLAVVDLRWIVFAAVAWTSSLAAQGARWRALIPPAYGERAPGPLGLARLVLGANVVGAALPGPAGELASALVVAERGVPFAAAFGAAVLGRVVALGVIGAGALLLGIGVRADLPESAQELLLWPTLLLACGGLSAPILAGFARPLGSAIERVADRVADRGTPDGWLQRAGPRLRAGVARAQEALDALATLPRRAWISAVGWSVVSLAIQSIAIRCAFGAVGAWPPWHLTAFLHLLMSLAAIAGILLPAGGLAVDALFVAVFPAVAGVDAGTAVLAAVSVRWMRVLVLLGGLPALGGMFERLVEVALSAPSPAGPPARRAAPSPGGPSR